MYTHIHTHKQHFIGHENVIQIYDLLTVPPDTADFRDVYIVTNLMVKFFLVGYIYIYLSPIYIYLLAAGRVS